MKAIMSEKLRNILNHPQEARELQKQLPASHVSFKIEKHGASESQRDISNNLIKSNNHAQ